MFPPPKTFLYLDAIARAGSIRGAAEVLNVASTALNRKLIELERSLGTPLFERLPRGVRLTSAGELLIGAIRRNLSDLNTVGSQIEQLRGLVRGRIGIACSESVLEDLLPTVIAEYQAKHPGVQFHVKVGPTAMLVDSLLAYDTDLLLAHDPPHSDALFEIATSMQQLCVLMRPDHPLAGRATLVLADLQNYAIAIGDATYSSRHAVDLILRRSRIPLRIALESNSARTLKQFARETGAICFQYEIGTRRDARSGEFVIKPLADRGLAKSRLVLASRQGRTLPVAALSFVEILKAALM